MRKNVLVTFDYELFLGENSGTVENNMLKPTDALLKVLKKHELTPVFFVDTTYLQRLKMVAVEHDKAREDFDKIINQLREVIRHGGYVFHHIHPHWLDAVYIPETNQWNLGDKSRFALANLSEEEIAMVFSQSDEIISEIYERQPLPPAFGFRAGGLYAQPFDIYRNEMLKHGISMDFSVLRNAQSTGAGGRYQFDYTACPEEDIYRFSDDITVRDDQGNFTEVSMNMFRMKGLRKIINGLYYRKNVSKESWKRFGDGSASGNVLKTAEKSAGKFLSEETFSIELLNDYKATLYTSYLNRNDFMHIISHPKLCSVANIEAFDRFMQQAKRKHHIVSDVFEIIESIK